MDMKRFWRHVAMSPALAARCFPTATLDAIEREIAALEQRHRGEVCFVVESELTTVQLWRTIGPRDRARELFAAHGVWNTEENNGVLIYVLLADRRVEIVADRGIDAAVDDGEWRAICNEIDALFHDARYQEGALAAVRRVSHLLEHHFPAAESNRNRDELDNRPIVM